MQNYKEKLNNKLPLLLVKIVTEDIKELTANRIVVSGKYWIMTLF